MNMKATPDKYDVFLDSYLHELMATPDSEILEGTSEAAERVIGLKILDKARTGAGKRRMDSAKAGLAQSVVHINSAKAPASAAAARAYLAERYGDKYLTLAARNLGELSDDDILSLYSKLLYLEEQSRKSKSDDSP
jgi:hypothetical protein